MQYPRTAGSVYDYGSSGPQQGSSSAAPSVYAQEKDYPDPWSSQSSQHRPSTAPHSRLPPSEAIRRLKPSSPTGAGHAAYSRDSWPRDPPSEPTRERESRVPTRAPPADPAYRSHQPRASPPGQRPSQSRSPHPGSDLRGSSADIGSSGNDANRTAIRSSLLQKLAAGAGNQVGLSAAQIDQVVQVVKLLNASGETPSKSGDSKPDAADTKPADRYSKPSSHPVDVSSADYGVSLLFPKDSPPPLVPIPTHLRKVAESGDYIHLHHLLFNSMHPSGAVKVAQEEAKAEKGMDILSSDGLTSLRSIDGWFIAWSRFMRCYLHKQPARAMELVRYQSFIVEMSTRYSSPAWMSYDTAFRQLVSRRPEIRWDSPDPELFRIWFTDARLRTQPLEADLQQATPRVVDAIPLAPGLTFPVMPVLPPPLVGLPPVLPVPPVAIPPVSVPSAAAKATGQVRHGNKRQK